MEWLKSLFVEHSALQAVVVISLISTIGIALGRIRIFGISLGVAFIFFAGILAGHFGLSIDPAMLNYAESFGLIIFVYALGLQVGPGFFNSLRADGLRLMSPALAVVLLGTGLAVAMSYTLHVSMPDMSGILCGATTNTPALGAAQQALQHLPHPVFAGLPCQKGAHIRIRTPCPKFCRGPPTASATVSARPSPPSASRQFSRSPYPYRWQILSPRRARRSHLSTYMPCGSAPYPC